jgi:hypothetical protein
MKASFYEADTLPGLETLAQVELGEVGVEASVVGMGRLLLVRPAIDSRILTRLYHGERFAVPRPKALLSNEHFPRLVGVGKAILAAGGFRTLRLVAAGRESVVMQRLQSTLATALSLAVDDEGTDTANLLVRVRPGGEDSWEVLFSRTPRPLSTRSWRVVDYPGAMNATLAAAMVRLTEPTPNDVFFNLCAGSGTLMVERAHGGAYGQLLGCDTEPKACEAAQANLAAAGVTAEVTDWDATQLPLPDACVDVLVADLPFGQRIGSHRGNTVLYPAVMAEATRVAAPGARLCLLTHEVNLLEEALRPYAGIWKRVQTLRVAVGGMHPRVFLLRKAV